MRGLAKEHRGIILILSLFLLSAIIFAFSRQRALIWDEAVYIGMGKFLFSQGNSGLWEIFRPITVPSIIGTVWWIGADAIIASKAIMICFALGCVALTYLLARRMFSTRIALLASIALAVTPVFLKYSEYILTDIPSLFFVLMAVYLVLRREHLLAGIFAGIAFLTKFPQLLIILPLTAYILFFDPYDMQRYDSLRHRISRVAIFAAGCLAVIILFSAFNIIIYSQHLSAIDSVTRPVIDAMAFQDNPLQNLPTDTFVQRTYSSAYYPINIVGSKGSLFFVLALITIIMSVNTSVRIACDNFFSSQKSSRTVEKHSETNEKSDKNEKNDKNEKDNKNKKSNTYETNDKKRRNALLYLILVVYLLYYSAIPYKTERFLLFFIPFISILSAQAFFTINDRIINNNNHARLARLSTQILLTVAIILAAWQITQFYEQKDISAQNSAATYDEITYSYFTRNNIKGTLLVTEPLFAAYCDNRLIPAYNTINNNTFYVNEWDEEAVVQGGAFREGAIPCADKSCIDRRDAMHIMLNSTYRLTHINRSSGWMIYT